MNKKIKRLAVIAAAAAMSLSAFAVAGCNNDGGGGGGIEKPPVVQEKKVSKIAVTTRPRLKYVVGEMFDKTGMVVTATYDDGTTEEVTDYTVDKTAPLTVRDNSVTITYKGKMAFLPLTIGIELYEKLSINSAENAVYTVEAESLDYSYCENSNLPGEQPNMESAKNASGGFSMGSLAVAGNMFGFKVTCSEEVNISLVIRASAVTVDMIFDDVATVFVNDITRRSEHTLTWGGDGAFWNWEHVYFRDITLKEGENEIYLKINTTSAPNIDCFYLIASPTGEEELGPGEILIPPTPEYVQVLEITDAEKASYLIEAESLDYSGCISSNNPNEQPNWESPVTETSGGLCVSSLGLPGNRFGFKVNSTVEADIKIVLRVSNGNPENQNLDEILQIKWNDTVLETNTTLVWENKWHDWKDVTVSGLKLEEGVNVFDFYVKTASAPNVDCFKIIVVSDSPVDPDEHECESVCETCGKCTNATCEEEVCADKCEGHEVTPPEPEYAKSVDVTSTDNATYTIEAESLDYSKCVSSNNPNGQPNTENPATVTSGGTCVSSLGVRGNKFGFTVASTVEGTANLTLRVSSGATSEQNLDTVIKLTWNGEDYYTNHIAPNPTDPSVGWHKWESAVMYNLPLVEGNNTFVLEVLTNACPNIDCFILEVSPDNSGVVLPEKPLEFERRLEITNLENAQYKIEAEALELTKCASNARQEYVPEASGSNILSTFGTQGNKVGFAVKSTVEGNINITIRCAAGGNGVQNLDELIKIVWNDVEYKTGASCADPQVVGWHQFQDVIILNLHLEKGDNLFSIEVIGDAAPNIDYFLIEVSPDNPPEEFEIPPVTDED